MGRECVLVYIKIVLIGSNEQGSSITPRFFKHDTDLIISDSSRIIEFSNVCVCQLFNFNNQEGAYITQIEMHMYFGKFLVEMKKKQIPFFDKPTLVSSRQHRYKINCFLSAHLYTKID